jgi:cob(I)alamin adenosyltransferase
MAKLKAVMDAKVARATGRKGLVIVHTGNGKGKTTAALGMLLRALGHGLKCAVIQFVKGDQESAEALLRSPLLTWDRCGEGFTWNTQDRQRDQDQARAGWDLALARLADPELGFLLLDELDIVLAHEYLPVAEVLAGLAGKSPELHVVITGRGAPEALVAVADLVAEMREIKHPFQAGIAAQKGIEF